jgi:hypothetical protein
MPASCACSSWVIVADRLSSQRVIWRVAGMTGPGGGAAVIARNGRTERSTA